MKTSGTVFYKEPIEYLCCVEVDANDNLNMRKYPQLPKEMSDQSLILLHRQHTPVINMSHIPKQTQKHQQRLSYLSVTLCISYIRYLLNLPSNISV